MAISTVATPSTADIIVSGPSIDNMEDVVMQNSPLPRARQQAQQQQQSPPQQQANSSGHTLNPSLTAEEVEEARKERNRQIARKSRERKRQELVGLEQRLKDLEALHKNVAQEISFLTADNEKLGAVNQEVRSNLIHAKVNNMRLMEALRDAGLELIVDGVEGLR